MLPGLRGIARDPLRVLPDGQQRIDSSRVDQIDRALKRFPWPLRGDREQLFPDAGAGSNDAAIQHVEFVARTQPAVIEIGQSETRSAFVGRDFGILFPVFFGSREIQLLFVFQSARSE